MPNHEGGHEVEGKNLDWQGMFLEMRDDLRTFKEDFREHKADDKEYKIENDKRVKELEYKAVVHDKDIANIQQTLGDIKDDTKWLRRTITGGLITSGIGGFVGIVIWLAQT